MCVCERECAKESVCVTERERPDRLGEVLVPGKPSHALLEMDARVLLGVAECLLRGSVVRWQHTRKQRLRLWIRGWA